MTEQTSDMGTSERQRGAAWVFGALGVVGLIGLTVLAYTPAFGAGLLWDDKPLIFDNPLIRSPDGLAKFWVDTGSPDYYPVTWSVLWAQYRVFGDDPAGYHIVNLLMHALLGVLIWRVLARLKVRGAWVAAAVFAVHPVTATTVMWISEQKNTLSGVIAVCVVLAYLRAQESKHWWLYGLSLVLFALALLAKSSMVMVPPVLLLIAWWRHGAVRRGDILRTAPFFLLSLAAGIVTIVFQRANAMVEGPMDTVTLPARIAGMGWNLGFYWLKALVPTGTTMVYPKWSIDPGSVIAWLPLAGVLVVFGVCWWVRRYAGRGPVTAFGFHALMVLPILGLLGMAYHQYAFVADHLQYAALIGPIALAVSVGGLLLTKIKANRVVCTILVGMILVGLAWVTHQRAQAYRDAEPLWRDTIERNPDAWVAYNNLGLLLDARGDFNEASRMYRKAIEVRPTYYPAYNNLGLLMARRGDMSQAARRFREAIEVWPEYERAHNNLGLALMQLQMYGHAEEALRRAVELSPGFAVAYVNLADVLNKQGKVDEAVRIAEQALDIAERAGNETLGDEVRSRLERYGESAGETHP